MHEMCVVIMWQHTTLIGNHSRREDPSWVVQDIVWADSPLSLDPAAAAEVRQAGRQAGSRHATDEAL